MFFFVADTVYCLTQHPFLTSFLLPTLLRKPGGAKYVPSLSALEATGWQWDKCGSLQEFSAAVRFPDRKDKGSGSFSCLNGKCAGCTYVSVLERTRERPRKLQRCRFWYCWAAKPSPAPSTSWLLVMWEKQTLLCLSHRVSVPCS